MRQFAPVRFSDVRLEGAFWKERLDTVLRDTIPSQHAKLEEYKILESLDALQPLGKELLIEGLVAAISHDGFVTVAESELLRTVCASLHCPLPPMLERAESRAS